MQILERKSFVKVSREFNRILIVFISLQIFQLKKKRYSIFTIKTIKTVANICKLCKY